MITGAGVSTESGIPDYRGEKGSYKHGHKPMMHNEFVSSLNKRRRYWARSLVGWKYFDERNPNYVHESLSLLEREGYVSGIVTQNVDRLHHRAGSKNVVELHGRNDVVRCLSCHADESRTRTNPAANRTPADIMFPMENKDPDNDNVMGRMDARNPIVPIRHNKMILNSVFVTSIV